ncbi:MAG: pyruvate, water dikinase, partial [Actinomycetota bacterium]|nr:pyruvate, water dikinase [Actinomycetota bacterium]
MTGDRNSSWALQSGYQFPDRDVALFVHRLEEIDVRLIDRVKAVFFIEKGFSSHVEVICRIKGIPLCRMDRLDYTQNAETKIPLSSCSGFTSSDDYRSFAGSFQVAIFDEGDLSGLDFTRIRAVFVRAEHLMYRAVTGNPGIGYVRDSLSLELSASLARIINRLPDHVEVIFRGLDVRSDDRVLGKYLFSSVENNPELGNHGTRYLLQHPEWTECLANAVSP